MVDTTGFPPLKVTASTSSADVVNDTVDPSNRSENVPAVFGPNGDEALDVAATGRAFEALAAQIGNQQDVHGLAEENGGKYTPVE